MIANTAFWKATLLYPVHLVRTEASGRQAIIFATLLRLKRPPPPPPRVCSRTSGCRWLLCTPRWHWGWRATWSGCGPPSPPHPPGCQTPEDSDAGRKSGGGDAHYGTNTTTSTSKQPEFSARGKLTFRSFHVLKRHSSDRMCGKYVVWPLAAVDLPNA